MGENTPTRETMRLMQSQLQAHQIKLAQLLGYDGVPGMVKAAGDAGKATNSEQDRKIERLRISIENLEEKLEIERDKRQHAESTLKERIHDNKYAILKIAAIGATAGATAGVGVPELLKLIGG